MSVAVAPQIFNGAGGGVNYAALDALLNPYAAKFTSFRIVIPKALLGDLSELRNLQGESVLRRALVILVNDALQAVPPMSMSALLEIDRTAKEITAKMQ